LNSLGGEREKPQRWPQKANARGNGKRTSRGGDADTWIVILEKKGVAAAVERERGSEREKTPSQRNSA